MKKVSVHIVTYNSDAFIVDCIESVMKQSYPIDRIIVVDNGSRDQTRQKLQEYREVVTTIYNQDNVGFAAGHNQAIHMAESDYYLVLNPDVILHPDYVYHLVQTMEADSGLGCATGKLVFKQSPDIIDSTGLSFTKSRRAFDRGAGQTADLCENKGYVIGVSGAAALYKKKMVQDVSIEGCFFDEDFFAYKEDVDVAWRSYLFGWKAFYCPQALAYHDRGWKKGARRQMPIRIRRFSYINRYKMIIKNDHWIYLLRHLLPIVAYEIPGFIYFLIKEPKVLGAWWDFLLKFGSLLRKRREIQGKRRISFREVYKFFE
ncbi:hypothetical protein PAESOLCIP111_05433 [Paenibacillus solanacearum]|uniref:Glycosyltransferase 2-like domain-containing protein n=1 Tax=Paenibacillus solanacearum TaxID=2048548 RepID=A0A916K915_9BACL|nr:glycosyltransferase family 2 protein [Paenibacillus solanacearum]CAG7647698.1 hypothetical protein PAESOLCIP111_05433 [Paenibacillus solanacearum]